MEPEQIMSLINDAGTIGLAIGLIVLLVKGTLIPTSVVTAIVADTTKSVLDRLECPLVQETAYKVVSHLWPAN